MKRLRFVGLVLLAVCLFAGSAYSATNIYKDRYTTEDSSGTWTFTGVKNTVFLIDAPADTTGTITAAKTGCTFIFQPNPSQTGATVGGNGYIMTLPSTSNGLVYRFVVATTTNLTIRPYSAHSKIKFFALDPGDALKMPATYCSIELTSYGSEWVVTDMATASALVGLGFVDAGVV